MSSTELGLNIISQYTDFNVKFDSITRDGSTLNLNTIGAWIFCMGQTLGTTGIITKASTGVASGDFSIVNASGYVSVAVRASELSNGYGTYWVNLYAETSGRRISHRPQELSIVQAVKSAI